ncbi:MAG: DUF4062 domain-containing protein [Acidobacteria bacterium]|nr:DUF4062 domain-containing protein [Acidobacteriota bacterium]
MLAKMARHVFLSSTLEDLKDWREKARDAGLKAGFTVVRCEDFGAGSQPPLSVCLDKLRECQVVVVLVGRCYGSVVDEQGVSYTEAECREAERLGIPVFPFFMDPKFPFAATEELDAFMALNKDKLAAFRTYLDGLRTRKLFTNPDNLGHVVYETLIDLRGGESMGSLHEYAAWLAGQTAYIDIRGLITGNEHAHQVPIENIYVPLTMAGGERGAVSLDEALEKQRLVIIGDPGSGKTTYLRRLARERSLRYLGDPTAELPLFVRISEFSKHLATAQQGPVGDGALWLPHFLGAKAVSEKLEITEKAFDKAMEAGATVFLDGLDEAPDEIARRRVCAIFQAASKAYGKCRFVVTTRPRAFEGTGLLKGFDEARIQPLEDTAVDTFLRKWSEHVYPANPVQAERHGNDLVSALRERPDIREMARNPVMLTALAVVHWNERRLPEQRAELYQSILKWLAEARQGEGRMPAQKLLVVLAELAYAMLSHRKGRQVELEKNEAADVLVPKHFANRVEALAFLEREELDSGIIASSGASVRFWHLTFLEHLAAVHLTGLTEEPRREELLRDGNAFRPEWRETVLLLAGILLAHGVAHVNKLVKMLIDARGRKIELEHRAALVGLVGGIVRDLETLKYVPEDERWKPLAQSILGIFEKEQARGIPFADRLDAAEALGRAGDPRLQNTVWIELPGGTFLMGAQKVDPKGAGYDPEEPVHRVTVSAFKLAKYPVTVSEYAAFLAADGYGRREFWMPEAFGKFSEPDAWTAQQKHPNRPVTNVSWFEAAAYAAWRGARLPTEAEWEYAARGTEGRKYPWGGTDPAPNLANYGMKPGHATPVGLYPEGQTPEGLCDLAGNVWEWVSDWYSSYSSGDQEDPQGPVQGQQRNLRGGSWSPIPGACGAPAVAGTRRRSASVTSASAWPGTGKPLMLES